MISIYNNNDLLKETLKKNPDAMFMRLDLDFLYTDREDLFSDKDQTFNELIGKLKNRNTISCNINMVNDSFYSNIRINIQEDVVDIRKSNYEYYELFLFFDDVEDFKLNFVTALETFHNDMFFYDDEEECWRSGRRIDYIVIDISNINTIHDDINNQLSLTRFMLNAFKSMPKKSELAGGNIYTTPQTYGTWRYDNNRARQGDSSRLDELRSFVMNGIARSPSE